MSLTKSEQNAPIVRPRIIGCGSNRVRRVMLPPDVRHEIIVGIERHCDELEREVIRLREFVQRERARK